MLTVQSADGSTIAYDAVGSGPPVILVGGAFSYRTFPKTVQLAQLLADHFTVVNYDRRGRGDSTEASAYQVDREVEDLRALVGEVGPASLWGWSTGAVLALRAAAAQLPVRRLASYEPPFLVDNSRPVPAADFASRLERHLAAGQRSAAVKLYMTEGMGAPGFFVGAMRMLPVWGRLKAVAHTLPYDWALLKGTLTGEPLEIEPWSHVTAPTLAMAGQKSPAQLRNAAVQLAARVPHARHEELAGQGHNPSMKVQARLLSEYFRAEAEPDRLAG